MFDRAYTIFGLPNLGMGPDTAASSAAGNAPMPIHSWISCMRSAQKRFEEKPVKSCLSEQEAGLYAWVLVGSGTKRTCKIR